MPARHAMSTTSTRQTLLLSPPCSTGPPYFEDVLVFGGHYIHCGQPMQTLGSQVRRLSAAAYTDRDPEDGIDVDLETRNLRCACGFQIELPE